MTDESAPPAADRPRANGAAAGALCIAGLVVAAWLVSQRFVPQWFAESPAIGTYVVQPILWLGLAGLSLAGWRALPQRPPFSVTLTGIAALVAGVHVGFFVLSGFVFGFGNSMAASDIADYPQTAWYLASWVIGIETTRPFLLFAWRPFSERWAFVATTGVLAVAMTPYGSVTALTDVDMLVSILAGTVAPIVMLSILLTWLADHGGLGPSMGYAAVLASFDWFSQVQPDIDWPARFVIGVLAPVVSASLIRRIYLDTEEGRARWPAVEHDEHHASVLGRHPIAVALGAVAALLAAVAVAAAVGLRPAVVTGISMEPSFSRGDLAILYRGIDPAEVRVGDVVSFRDSFGRPVVHRIVAIEERNGELVFVAQGDNNARQDEPFGEEALDAKVVLIVPEVGWPALWLNGG